MKITFWGAARQVTGSKFLLELDDGYKILVDCGTDLSRERQDGEAYFSFEPSDIDLVLLTHAHIDHSGAIPLLYQYGYTGQVLCTTPTYALTELLLRDAAGINSQRIQKKWNPKKKKLKEFIPDDVYLDSQVDFATRRFVNIAYNEKFAIKQGVYVTFIPAGHLLGAANIIIHTEENGVEKSIAFTGDLGRNDYPLLVDPQGIPQVDYLVCESTYGNRNHSDEGNPEDLLENIIARTCVDKPGRLIIPAFSVGRTQSLLFTLNKLSIERRLPSIRVFADSPMAEQSTMIYQNHVSYMNEKARAFNEANDGLFDFDNLICTSSHAESKAISNYNQPSIIIASSGMLTGGRMNYHIRKNMGNPYCSIMFIGYCAEGTPGHQLTHSNTLRVQGRDIPVDAKILHTDIYSGHADCRDLTRFIKGIDKTQLKKIFLVHGDYESMKGLNQVLCADGYSVEIPEKGQQYILT